MLGVLLDAIFPPRCAGCGRGPSPFCDRCHASLLAIEPPWCVRCGRPAERDVDGCAWCPPPPVAIARAPFVFRGPARSALLRLKFAGWRVVATALGEAMSEVNGCASPDAVCWVPLSRRGIARRGYDQARALAEVVAARLAVPARPLLDRARDPGPQARRGGAERRAALAGVYRPSRDAAVPPRVLLVDDVLTTGATASACAAALVAAGASEVGLLTAARALPGRLPARYTPRGLPSGSVVAWGAVPRKSMPAAGETTHVRRPLVAEHGAV
jgi:predicted amidophosphoribosyltransferase